MSTLKATAVQNLPGTVTVPVAAMVWIYGTGPAIGEVPTWNGTHWVPGTGGGGGGLGFGYWRWSTATSGAPANGHIAVNNAVEASVTQLRVASLSDDGTDYSVFLDAVDSGDIFYIQDQDDATSWVRFGATGSGTHTGGYWMFPVAFVSGSGALFANSHKLAVEITFNTAAGGGSPTGPAGGVLSGTYPNPGFAVDMATQAELDAAIATREPTITAGTAAQYWRGDKSWQDLGVAVRGTALTGLSTVTAAIITSADIILTALAKLQAQILQRGIPAGGTTGQVLAKVDGTDYNTAWATASGGGGFAVVHVTSGTTVAAAVNTHYLIEVANAVVITAPTFAVDAKWKVTVCNGRLDNSIAWNSANHMGKSDATFTLSGKYASFEIIGVNSTYGWALT